MKKIREFLVLRRLKKRKVYRKLGIDLDGDLVYYKNRTYYVNIFNNEIHEIKREDEHENA